MVVLIDPSDSTWTTLRKYCGVEPLNLLPESDKFVWLRNAHAPPKKCPKFQFKQTSNFIINVSGCFLNTSSLQSLTGGTFWQSQTLPMKDLPLSPVRQKKQSPCRRFRRSSRRRSSRRRCFGAPQVQGSFCNLGLGKESEVAKLVVFSSLCIFSFLVPVKSMPFCFICQTAGADCAPPAWGPAQLFRCHGNRMVAYRKGHKFWMVLCTTKGGSTHDRLLLFTIKKLLFQTIN